MRKLTITFLILFGATLQNAFSQSYDEYKSKNYIFLQLNNHMEKRGSDIYYTSNPDLALSYERNLFTIGRNNFLIGVRTGFYKEYVLTGQGWDHPTKTRFFIGTTPAYRIDIAKRIKIQVNFLWDILLPDDYDETWSYFALEPSFNFYFTEHLYAGISATMGVFQFFEPKAYMDKAGIKFGFAF
ncbi:MAG: hypothetical protein PF485_13050 [Bacteroidales bacterium]|jgi:hypothetical protein|nr:hypothetical protein [Bacteroidales bacterium]